MSERISSYRRNVVCGSQVVNKCDDLILRLNLRDSHAGIGKIERATYPHSTFWYLVFWLRPVLDMPGFCVDRVKFRVCQIARVRMSCWTMVAFIVVVSQCLPIVITAHLPYVVKAIVFEIEVFEPGLHVNTLKIIVPFDLFVYIEVYPYKAYGVNMNVDWKKTILQSVEALYLFVSRCFSQLAVQSIGPAMVLAGYDLYLPLRLSHKWESTVSTDVVKSTDQSLTIPANKKLEARLFKSDIIASSCESVFVCDHNPPLRENRSPLEMVDGIGPIPRGRKTSRCSSSAIVGGPSVAKEVPDVLAHDGRRMKDC